MIDECRCADSFPRSFTSSPHLRYARDSHILRSIVAEVRARTARSDAVPLKRFAAPLRRERQLGIHLGQQFSRFCILATACPPIPAIENPPFIHAEIGVGEQFWHARSRARAARPRAWSAWRSN